MNNKSDCHPETPESGQQTNSKENLDTSERGTLVPPHPQNGIKNTEMTSNQPKVDNSHHWENPRICATCIHYTQNRCNLTSFHFSPEHTACPRYIPKQTD